MGFHGMTLLQLLTVCRDCRGVFFSPTSTLSSNTMSPHFKSDVNSSSLKSLWEPEPEPRVTPGHS